MADACFDRTSSTLSLTIWARELEQLIRQGVDTKPEDLIIEI